MMFRGSETNETAVAPEEAEGARSAILAFIQRRFPEVACFMTTLRKDGRPVIRQVSAFVEATETSWTISTVSQSTHLKNVHVRNNPIVTYLWIEPRPTEYRMFPNVWAQGRCA
ncbi:MAG: pyridoxamine 5'-phosphate oxidase family protein, partial [Dehalococcoidia bacterium]|nr:pyridoxamine 5'-phosphate oxidase family protein [Dehalococcoidia bacterium]